MFGSHLLPWAEAMLLVVLAVVLLSLVLGPLTLILRHLRFRCQLAHQERMKALEVGCPLDALDVPRSPSQYMQNAFWLSFCMGVVFPITAVCAAAWATRRGAAELSHPLGIWVSVAVGCVAAVICAVVILAGSRPGPAPQVKLPQPGE